ncbi:MAG: nitroreductase family protein [Planctomycetales bacterium]|nr:nitroreductase family protein [Planctomycetales bacterium]
MRKRRSVRKFENRAVEPEKVELLKEAVLRSPSSRSFDPWEFVFVSDQSLLKKLSKSKPHGAEFLKGAALGIVVCAAETKSDVWVEDCAIASILAQLTAQSLGLGSCWIQIRKRSFEEETSSEAYIRGVLGMPDTLRVLSIIAVGYPAEQPEPIPRKQLKDGKIHLDRW